MLYIDQEEHMRLFGFGFQYYLSYQNKGRDYRQCMLKFVLYFFYIFQTGLSLIPI